VTNALKEVFDEASKLPESEQDALAAAIRAEMEADAATLVERLDPSADALAEYVEHRHLLRRDDVNAQASRS